MTTTQVTIVVTDIDDQIPVFNENNFHISVSEDIGKWCYSNMWVIIAVTFCELHVVQCMLKLQDWIYHSSEHEDSSALGYDTA